MHRLRAASVRDHLFPCEQNPYMDWDGCQPPFRAVFPGWRKIKIFTCLAGQSCRAALDSWAAQQRRPAEDLKILVPRPFRAFFSAGFDYFF